MISNAFEAKLSITKQPSIIAAGLTRQKAIAAIHFGSNDTATTTASLPEWTKQVKDPPVTLPSLLLNINNDSNDPSKIKLFIILKLVWQTRKLAKDIKANHDEYLPKQNRQDLKKYHWTIGYWYNRIFHSQKAKLMDSVYRGPIDIKFKQQMAGNIPAWKKELEKLKKGTGNATLNRLEAYVLKNQIKTYEPYTPLLNKVPALPYEKFEKQLKELQSTYNQNHSADPITSIDKNPIGTGSMGQVYKATTKGGKSLVLKVIKPEITLQFLEECLPLVYYRNMLLLGTTPHAKQKAAKHAQETVNILKDETQPEKEANNTKLMQQWAVKLKSNFKIPDVLHQTKSGLIMQFVGNQDIASLSDTEKDAFKTKMASDMARFLALSSAKPLDLHDGNMRTGDAAYWLDHGRQMNIPEATHQKLLQLMLMAYSSPQADNSLGMFGNALLQPTTRLMLKDLLQTNPTANNTDLENLKKLDSISNLNESAIKLAQTKAELQKRQIGNLGQPETTAEKALGAEIQQLQRSVQPFVDLQKRLSEILGQPPAMAEIPKTASGQYPRNLEKPLPAPSILNAWASSSLYLPGFASGTLPQSDIAQYKAKANGFFAPYIQDSKAEKKRVIDRTTGALVQKLLLTNDQEKKLQQLSSQLADGLLEQTGAKKPADADYQRLIHNIKFALQQDLLPNSISKSEA